MLEQGLNLSLQNELAKISIATNPLQKKVLDSESV